MAELTPEQIKKQELYRDARFTDQYDDIWQSVGKCVFCELNEKYVFFEENGVVMTISLYAYIDGHFMIIPRRHVRSAKELTDLEWTTIRKFTYIAKRLIKEVHGVKGMQLIQKDGAAAQSTVEHIHFHCIPFDSPDLLKWNYRELKYTPLQNVALYKHARKTIIKADKKFQEKYSNTSAISVVCDILIIDTDNNILFEERTADTELSPNYITIPGGKVNDYGQRLEDELAREVYEETNYQLDATKLALVSSKIDQIDRKMNVAQLGATYTMPDRFVRNTYLLRGFDAKNELTAGDDAKTLTWVPLAEIANHQRISPSTKDIISKALAS